MKNYNLILFYAICVSGGEQEVNHILGAFNVHYLKWLFLHRSGTLMSFTEENENVILRPLSAAISNLFFVILVFLSSFTVDRTECGVSCATKNTS